MTHRAVGEGDEDVQRIQRANGVAMTTDTAPRRRRRNSSTGYLRLLADCLLLNPGIKRPALCRQLGLSRQLVSGLLATLEIAGLVHVEGSFDGVPGRSRQSYTLHADAILALGFEIGTTAVAGAICDMGGTLIAERTEPHCGAETQTVVAQLVAMADALCADAGVSRLHVRQTAVCMSATVDPRDPDTPNLSPGGLLVEPLELALFGPVCLVSACRLPILEVSRQRMLAQLFGPVSPA